MPQWVLEMFFFIYLCHVSAYLLLPAAVRLLFADKTAAVVLRKDNALKLSRFLVDFVVMAWFSVLGFQVLEEFGGSGSLFSSEAAGGEKLVARVYKFSDSALFLSRLQVAYEAKNLIDSWYFGDGAVFIGHHIATGLLAVYALHPYLHVYASFFFGTRQPHPDTPACRNLTRTCHNLTGIMSQLTPNLSQLNPNLSQLTPGISEISTVFLCVLACFDESRGVLDSDGKNLFAKLFPTAMKVSHLNPNLAVTDTALCISAGLPPQSKPGCD